MNDPNLVGLQMPDRPDLAQVVVYAFQVAAHEPQDAPYVEIDGHYVPVHSAEIRTVYPELRGLPDNPESWQILPYEEYEFVLRIRPSEKGAPVVRWGPRPNSCEVPSE